MKDKNDLREHLGFVVPSVTAITLIALTRQFSISIGEANGFYYSEVIIIPMLMGIMSSWYWRDSELTNRQSWLYNLVNCIISAILSGLVLGEGAICLLIVSPLLWCFIMVGYAIGKQMFKKENTGLNVSIVSVLTLVFIADVLSKHEYQNAVSDTIVIHAPPAKVWQNVVAFEPINNNRNFGCFA